MDCHWTVDQSDGCTLHLECVMRDACDKDECYDLDMLIHRAIHTPYHVDNPRIITGPAANLSDDCTTKCGKVCVNPELTRWEDYIPSVNVTPYYEHYVEPIYNTTVTTLKDYIITPSENWIVTPLHENVLSPVYTTVIEPCGQYAYSIFEKIYEYMPSLDISTIYNWFDIYTVEFLIHFLACVVSVAALITVLFVYFGYVFLDKSRKPLAPLKEIVPEQSSCSPNCSEKHTHRRYSYPRRKSSVLQEIQRRLTHVARTYDEKDEFGFSRNKGVVEDDDDVFIKANGT